jgi:hypothetical protein
LATRIAADIYVDHIENSGGIFDLVSEMVEEVSEKVGSVICY